MPELPEVETVRSGLASSILGFTISDVEILDARSLKRNAGGPKSFVREATGAKLSQVVRRGKFFWFPVSKERALVGHLGMSGQILVRKPGEAEDKCSLYVARSILKLQHEAQVSEEMPFLDEEGLDS